MGKTDRRIPCRFCYRWFGSRQQVRGHLRTCPPYLAAKAAGLTIPRDPPVFKECLTCGNRQVAGRICKDCGGRSFGRRNLEWLEA